MIERSLLARAETALEGFPVVGLVGPRQVGKTTLARFSYALFFKGFTGLAITIGSIATLFVAMQTPAASEGARYSRRRIAEPNKMSGDEPAARRPVPISP